MKIRAEITAVETHGDSLQVTMQGKGKTDAGWRPFGRHVIAVPATPRNGKVYHVGKTLTLEARPS